MFYMTITEGYTVPYRRGRRRMRRMAPIIQSFRQIFDKGITLAGSVVDNTGICITDDTTEIGALNTNVPTGSKVFRIRVTLIAQGASGSDSGNFQWYLAKSRDGQLFTSYPAPNAMGNDKLRNQIFHSEFGAFGTQDGMYYKFDRWIKIPKIYQRMRAGDSFFIKTNSTSAGTVNYVITHHHDYKIYQ